MSRRCWAEVDLTALRENLAWLRSQLGSSTRILTVVKADAYGHGLKPIAALLMQSGTDIFGVANLAEARAVRSVGQGWPILMLGACLPDEVESAVRDQVMPTISTLEEARWFSAAATKCRQTVRVHVKIDTGMGRLGFPPERAVRLLRQFEQCKGLQLQGMYTHFSSAEDDADFTAAQARRFQGLVRRTAAAGLQIADVHVNNSAAFLHEPGTRFNLVRPGLLVYGLAPPGRRICPADLQPRVRPALSFKCRVSLVKTVPPGTPLSYGHVFVTPRRMRIATLTAGYGDGYSRAGSGRAHVLIGGRRCPVLGRITMDQMLADVTAIPRVLAGDEVVLIGAQGAETITAHEVATWANTIAWEVLTSINYRVPRIYRGGSAA